MIDQPMKPEITEAAIEAGAAAHYVQMWGPSWDDLRPEQKDIHRIRFKVGLAAAMEVMK